MRVGFIVNPNSGVRDDAVDQTRRFVDAIGGNSVEAVLEVTHRAGEARFIAQDFASQGFETVVSIGGDGTVNETASGLVDTQTALAVVPFGSGNGFARSLGIPLNTEAALNLALSGKRIPIDVGEIHDGEQVRYFVGLAGVGFDAHVADIFNGHAKKRGLLSYIRIVSREYGRFEPEELHVTADERNLTGCPLIVAVTNTREYGNGAIISPHADYDDGMFNVVVIEKLGLGRFIWHLPDFFRGTLDSVPGVSICRAKTVSISGKPGMIFHTDGEPFSSGGKLEFRITRRRILVTTPAD